MTFLITPEVASKEFRQAELSFDLNAFLAEVTIPDDFFRNVRNWRSVSLQFTNNNQNIYVNLVEGFSRGVFRWSEGSRSGTWELTAVLLQDSYMGVERIAREDLVSPEAYDVELLKIVAPSSIASALSLASATVPLEDVGYYESGYKVKVWDTLANAWFSEEVLEIGEYTSDDTFNFVSPLTGELVEGRQYQLRFPDYYSCVGNQKGRFVFVGEGF